MKVRKRKRTELGGLVVLGGQEDSWFLRPARDDGDWDLFADYVEQGNVITPEMRKYIARILRGEVARPARRPRKRETAERMQKIIYFVHNASRGEGGQSKAIKAAAKEFRVDVRTVQRAMQFDRWYNSIQAEDARQDAYSEMQDEWNDQNEGSDDN